MFAFWPTSKSLHNQHLILFRFIGFIFIAFWILLSETIKLKKSPYNISITLFVLQKCTEVRSGRYTNLWHHSKTFSYLFLKTIFSNSVSSTLELFKSFFIQCNSYSNLKWDFKVLFSYCTCLFCFILALQCTKKLYISCTKKSMT